MTIQTEWFCVEQVGAGDVQQRSRGAASPAALQFVLEGREEYYTLQGYLVVPCADDEQFAFQAFYQDTDGRRGALAAEVRIIGIPLLTRIKQTGERVDL